MQLDFQASFTTVLIELNHQRGFSTSKIDNICKNSHSTTWNPIFHKGEPHVTSLTKYHRLSVPLIKKNDATQWHFQHCFLNQNCKFTKTKGKGTCKHGLKESEAATMDTWQSTMWAESASQLHNYTEISQVDWTSGQTSPPTSKVCGKTNNAPTVGDHRTVVRWRKRKAAGGWWTVTSLQGASRVKVLTTDTTHLMTGKGLE